MGDNTLTFECDAVMDIAAVADLKSQLQALLAGEEGIVLDGDNVERIDGAALQLLASFYREASRLGTPPRWQGASEALTQAATLLGLSTHIGLDDNRG